MSFTYSQRGPVQKAIQDACKNTGWNGFTINEIEHINGITDEIIAKINQSQFIIAEFTENKHGVYWEAGYAAERGIPVIYVVKNDEIQKLHFDTRHINHITWDNVEELKSKLIHRINAVINRNI